MKKVFVTAVALFLFPAAARAVVTVHVDPGPYTWNGQDQVVSWEVYATPSNPNENEQLNAFTLQLDMPDWTPDGIHFLLPPKNERGWYIYEQPTEHPYVFAGFADSDPFDPSGGSDYHRVRLAGVIADPRGSADIGPGREGLGKIDVFVPKDSRVWGTVSFEPMFLSFANLAGNEIPSNAQSGTWLVVPEPTSLAFCVGAAPLLLMRRRRRAATRDDDDRRVALESPRTAVRGLWCTSHVAGQV